MFISLNKDGGLQLNVVAMPQMEGTRPGSARDPFADALRHLAVELEAIAYFTIMEIWMRKGTKDKSPPPPVSLDWADDPYAKESVFACLETGVGTSTAYMPIIRKPGKPPTFAPGAVWEKANRTYGRWTSILPESVRR